MKTKNITLVLTVAVLIVLLQVSRAHAGHLQLRPVGFLATKASSTQPVSGCAILFDLSQIPADEDIDLAELRVEADVDTSFDEMTDVYASAAGESWVPSSVACVYSIAQIDSIAASGLVFAAADTSLIVNVTHVVSLWHSGSLTNQGLVLQVPGNTSKLFAVRHSGTDAAATLEVFFSK